MELIKGVTPGISDQLLNDNILHPLEKLLQAGRLWLVVVLLEELLCCLVLWLGLGTANSP